MQEYIKYLEQSGRKVYYGGGIRWKKYRGVLIPASPLPCDSFHFKEGEARNLIKRARVPFIRWTSDFTDGPTEWWWIISRPPFSLEILSSKLRNQIRRGLKNCEIRKIDALWLAEFGYTCYSKAFQRYKSSKPIEKKTFVVQEKLKDNFDCFEFWGVFVEGELAGYCECIIIDNRLAINIVKYYPKYLRLYSAYALTYTILNYYINEKKVSYISNSMRSIAHDTKMQEFLMKFNFRREFCRLNVVYSQLFGVGVKTAFMLEPLVSFSLRFFPASISARINTLLKQEEIRRTFL